MYLKDSVKTELLNILDRAKAEAAYKLRQNKYEIKRLASEQRAMKERISGIIRLKREMLVKTKGENSI
jgi:1,2-phenylacetyl-CoA epoxidase catalytic subunit